jgi:hypothetical protein
MLKQAGITISQEIDRFLVYFDNESAFHPISVSEQKRKLKERWGEE